MGDSDAPSSHLVFPSHERSLQTIFPIEKSRPLPKQYVSSSTSVPVRVTDPGRARLCPRPRARALAAAPQTRTPHPLLPFTTRLPTPSQRTHRTKTPPPSQRPVQPQHQPQARRDRENSTEKKKIRRKKRHPREHSKTRAPSAAHRFSSARSHAIAPALPRVTGREDGKSPAVQDVKRRQARTPTRCWLRGGRTGKCWNAGAGDSPARKMLLVFLISFR